MKSFCRYLLILIRLQNLWYMLVNLLELYNLYRVRNCIDLRLKNVCGINLKLIFFHFLVLSANRYYNNTYVVTIFCLEDISKLLKIHSPGSIKDLNYRYFEKLIRGKLIKFKFWNVESQVIAFPNQNPSLSLI